MPAGRPRVDNNAILDEIKKDEKKLDYFRNIAKEVEDALLIIAGAQDKVKAAITDAAEELGLSKGFISKTIKNRFEGRGDALLAEAEAQHEIIELLDKTPSEQAADEEF